MFPHGRSRSTSSCAGSRVWAKSRPSEVNATAVAGISPWLLSGNEQGPAADWLMADWLMLTSDMMESEPPPPPNAFPPAAEADGALPESGNCRNGRGAEKSAPPACATATHI